MDVAQALRLRRSVRDFLPTPVSGALIRRLLSEASRAPSGGNVQPWHIDVIAGDRLDALKAIVRERLAADARGEPAEQRDYDIYPPDLPAPYRDYRFGLTEAMYATMGIPRADKPARLAWVARNFEFFGAPMALFCSIGRGMGRPQWVDLGMYLQSLMLLLVEQGLDSCPQEAWSRFPQTVARFIDMPPERMLFCGMAIGHANPEHPVNKLVSERAGLETFARFHGV